MYVFWIYSAFSVWRAGSLSRSVNSPPFLMILGLLESTMMLFKGPEKMIGSRFCLLEIFYFSVLVGRYSLGHSIIHHFLCS